MPKQSILTIRTVYKQRYARRGGGGDRKVNSKSYNSRRVARAKAEYFNNQNSL